MIFAIKWVKIRIVPSFWLKFDDVTVTLSLAVLSGNIEIFFWECILILPYSIPNFVKIECHLHG